MEVEKAVVEEWLIFTSCGSGAQLYHWNLEQWTALKTNFAYSSMFCASSFWRTVGCLESLRRETFVCEGEKPVLLVSYLWWCLVMFSSRCRVYTAALQLLISLLPWEHELPWKCHFGILKVVFLHLYLLGKVPWVSWVGFSGTGVIIWMIIWSMFQFSIETLSVNVSYLSK